MADVTVQPHTTKSRLVIGDWLEETWIEIGCSLRIVNGRGQCSRIWRLVMRHLSHRFRSHSLQIERKVVLALQIPSE